MLDFDPTTFVPQPKLLLCSPLKSPSTSESGRIYLAPQSVHDVPYVEILKVGADLDPSLVGQFALVDLTRGRLIHGSNEAGLVGRSYIVYHIDDLQALIEPDAPSEPTPADEADPRDPPQEAP